MAHARYLVAERTVGWFISFEQDHYGPFPGGRVAALIAAVQAAQQAGKDGHDACVRLRAADGSVRIVWVFGSDSYPPVWVEEMLRELSMPRRAGAGRSAPARKESPSGDKP